MPKRLRARWWMAAAGLLLLPAACDDGDDASTSDGATSSSSGPGSGSSGTASGGGGASSTSGSGAASSGSGGSSSAGTGGSSSSDCPSAKPTNATGCSIADLRCDYVEPSGCPVTMWCFEYMNVGTWLPLPPPDGSACSKDGLSCSYWRGDPVKPTCTTTDTADCSGGTWTVTSMENCSGAGGSGGN